MVNCCSNCFLLNDVCCVFINKMRFALIFAAVNHLSRPVRKEKFTSRSCPAVGGFQFFSFVSVIQGSLAPVIIMIDGNENAIVSLVLE